MVGAAQDPWQDRDAVELDGQRGARGCRAVRQCLELDSTGDRAWVLEDRGGTPPTLGRHAARGCARAAVTREKLKHRRSHPTWFQCNSYTVLSLHRRVIEMVNVTAFV